MREIKFRAWDKDKMIYSSSFEFDSIFWSTVELNSLMPEVDKHFVMQYTGLKDKNGKEIYEGDIVRAAEPVSRHKGLEGGTAIVEWAEDIENDRYWWHWTGFSINLSPNYGEASPDNLEVIGNIYENKKLLK